MFTSKTLKINYFDNNLHKYLVRMILNITFALL